MSTKELEIELEGTEWGYVTADMEVEWREVDASFSHEFGIEQRTEVEIVDVWVLEGYDQDGERMETACGALRDELEEAAKEQFYTSL